MSNLNIWKKYIKENIISSKLYLKIYKAFNKETREYVIIKEIDKLIYNKLFNISFDIKDFKKKINNINTIQDILDTKNYFYIIMDLCLCNIKQYLQSKKEKTSFEEIQNILKQLNTYFKKMKEEKIIHSNLKLSKILLSINNKNEITYSLSDYGLNGFDNRSKSYSLAKTIPFTLPPELLKGENKSNNSDIWSLGIIIYYICFKEYPFTGINEFQIMNNIELNNKLNKINDEHLDDLVNKMLKVNVKDRISWDNYFKHPFFLKNFSKESKNENQDYNFFCKIHSINLNSYCKDCKSNICYLCFMEKHNNHNITNFNEIGYNENEINEIKEIIKEIDNNIIKYKENKKNIEMFIKKISKVKNNKNIYDNDIENNYKQIYINTMKKFNEKIKQILEINLMNIFDNYIICEYLIENNLNERILNSFDETYKEDWSYEGIPNEKEMKEKYELYINYKKIDFCYNYNFPKKGKYILKIKYLNLFENMSFIFHQCSTLISVNLSNFNSKKVNNLTHLFDGCTSLVSLDLSNFYSNNVINMSYMFSYCSSLISLNLSNFNTNNVINMSYMFYNCSSLNYLDLSSFYTNNVIDMSAMFYNCSSLISFNFPNFNTQKVTNMSFMFSGCSSLSSLNISHFSFNKVNNLNNMFSNCTSLVILNLSNLVVNENCIINGIFNRLNENCNVQTNDKILLKLLNN